MKFLKGLALGLLSFLLFLSLSIFGLAFTINRTVLNPKFVVSEINKLDVPALAGEVLSKDMPAESRAALIDTITQFEPQIKEQTGAIIYPFYDYLLGKSQSLDLALILSNSFLKPDFIASLMDSPALSSMAEKLLVERITAGIPGEMATKYADTIITKLRPWIKEQAGTILPPVTDYLLGKSQSVNVVVSLEPVIKDLHDSLKADFLKSPPPELASLPSAALDAYFEDFFKQITANMPTSMTIDESMLGIKPVNIAEATAGVKQALEQPRQFIGLFQLIYKLLLGFILLLLLGIILIEHQVKGVSRRLGTTFMTCGVIDYGSAFIAKHFAGIQMAQLNAPTWLQAWLPQLFKDLLSPLEMFSIGLLIAGVALIIVSFVYRPRQPSSAESLT